LIATVSEDPGPSRRCVSATREEKGGVRNLPPPVSIQPINYPAVPLGAGPPPLSSPYHDDALIDRLAGAAGGCPGAAQASMAAAKSPLRNGSGPLPVAPAGYGAFASAFSISTLSTVSMFSAVTGPTIL
jgi:hypothetical protein